MSPQFLEKPYEGVCIYAVNYLCVDCIRAKCSDYSCLLGVESDADLGAHRPSEPPAVPAAGSQPHACLVLCQHRVTLCRLFHDRLFALLHELLPLPFGGGLAERFWALRTRIPPCAGAMLTA